MKNDKIFGMKDMARGAVGWMAIADILSPGFVKEKKERYSAQDSRISSQIVQIPRSHNGAGR